MSDWYIVDIRDEAIQIMKLPVTRETDKTLWVERCKATLYKAKIMKNDPLLHDSIPSAKAYLTDILGSKVGDLKAEYAKMSGLLAQVKEFGPGNLKATTGGAE